MKVDSDFFRGGAGFFFFFFEGGVRLDFRAL